MSGYTEAEEAERAYEDLIERRLMLDASMRQIMSAHDANILDQLKTAKDALAALYAFDTIPPCFCYAQSNTGADGKQGHIGRCLEYHKARKSARAILRQS